MLPADIAAEYATAVAIPHERHGSTPTTASIFPGSLAPASAAITAVAVTAAAGPLASRDPREAASGLRRVFRTEETQSWSRTRTASPALQAVRLTALGRTAELPAASDPAAAQSRARQAPALFWLSWTARLTPLLPGTTPQERRRSLSAAFLAITTGTSPAGAARTLGNAIAGPSVTPILLRAERDPRWPASVAALTRLAGWLDEHGTQIDYQRRRHLDYRSLLPEANWIQACRSTGTVPGEQSRSLPARRWLFERISGTPADLAPGAYAVTTADQRSRLDKFAVFVTPGLVASLTAMQAPGSQATAQTARKSPGARQPPCSAAWTSPAPPLRLAARRDPRADKTPRDVPPALPRATPAPQSTPSGPSSTSTRPRRSR